MPLNSKIEIKSTGGIHGHAWFAKEVITKGEWLWKKRADGAPNTDIFLTLEQVQSLPPEKREQWLSLAYQVDDNVMCGFDPEKEPLYEELTENFINHSCSGNAWYEGADLLIAKRKIEVGEEICYDYALTENHPSFVIEKCLCGTDDCRGRITGNDWKQHYLQRAYGQHFAPHVQKDVNALRDMTFSLRALKKGFNALLDYGGYDEFAADCEKVWQTIQKNPTVCVDVDQDMEYVDPELTESVLKPEHAWFRILEYGRTQKTKA